jgi:(1->4)-alpha-D-glucan 1-alpha-D-glucosylmutase
MQKAAREAKMQTSWINPNTDYEDDLTGFVRGVTLDDETPGVLDDYGAALARAGFANRLSQLVLKITAPGVPDVYRGTELADLTLVDPDNRRPVDWARRRNQLDALERLVEDPDLAAVADLVATPDPTAYLYLTARLLRWRRAHPEAFAAAGYAGLDVEGPGADDWLAFARTPTDGPESAAPETSPDAAGSDAALLTIVARNPLSRDPEAEAHLPVPEELAGRRWTDVVTGQSIDPGAAIDLTERPVSVAVLASRLNRES